MAESQEGNHTHSNADGTTHDTTFWNDGDGLTHRESYDVDSEGNVTGLHYVQSDGHGTKVAYDYHTDEWEDKSK